MKDSFGAGKLVSGMLSSTVAALILFGCATLDKDECINADWQAIGFEDGARGYKTSRIGSHRKACAKHGVTPDFELYKTGHRQGLEHWCTPRNGYGLGARGKSYNGVCPEELAPAFLEAFNRGRALHAYENEVKKAEAELKKMHAQLEAMDEEILSLEVQMVQDGVSPRRRMRLLDEMRLLEDERRLFLYDIDDMEQTLEDMQANLNRMRANNP
jgi:hypothetical protein